MKFSNRKTQHLQPNFLFGFLAVGLFLALPVLTLAAPGDLDLSFGSGGKVITPVGSSFDYAQSVAIQSDGKIVAAGYSYNGTTNDNDFAVVRYNTDGTLDTSFGGTGKVITPVGSSGGIANSVAIQADGKIVAAGYIGNNGTNADFAVVRYNTDGTLDTSFGGTGKVVTQVSSSSDAATSVAIQSDGKIVAAGYSVNSANTDFAVVRYNSNGTLDTSFNGTGKVVTPVGSSHDVAQSVAIQADGKIVAAGSSVNGTTNDFAVVRYNTNGTLDTSFNGTGKVVTPIGSNSGDSAASVAIQSDGRIVAAGDSRGADYDFAVVRYNSNGTLDTSFNGTGKVVTPIGSRGDRASSVAIQPDGKIVAAGRSSNGTDHDFALVRYLGDSNSNVRTRFDFDGDGRADISVFRPSNRTWYFQQSANGFTGFQFGDPTDKLVPADFDGDGKTDIAVYRDGTWYLQRSKDGFLAISFGDPTDIPMPADFDGDGKSELAVFRPSNGTWYVLKTTNAFNAVQFGTAGDIPVVDDYDGDAKADYAVYRPSEGVWYMLRSRDGFAAVQFGNSTDKPVPADYDGDGKSDVAVYRPSEGNWYQLRSTLGFYAVQFGNSTDMAVPADYDGDGKTDVAVFRPSEGTWYQLRSTLGFNVVQFGANGDRPIPNAFVP